MEKGLKMRRMKKHPGLILVFTGNGKGKTTAAMGTAFRMISHGGRVGVVQFFKNKTRDLILGPRFKSWSFGGGFTWRVAREENTKVAQKAWKQCCKLLKDSKYDLVIFDELHIALRHQFLKISDVLHALKHKRSGQHVILTGRSAPQAIIRLADLVTEMKCVKHPFQRGVCAQPGIEF